MGPRPLAVTIDAHQLTGQSAHSGIGSYVRGLIGGLAADPELAVTALATADAVLPPGVARHTVTRRWRTGRPAVWENELRRHIELRRRPGDVIHNPNPHAPLAPPHPWVQTLFDVIPLAVDDPATVGFQRRFERFSGRYRHAEAVIAISRHAADEGIRRLGLDPSRLEVVHLGVGPEYHPAAPAGAAPYLLMVCEYSPRKGLTETLAVLDALADAGYPHRLKIAGRVPSWRADDFERRLAACAHRERVDVCGFVDDLAALYQQAALLLVLSRYEGFGLPALEAMACATPVVAFTNTSLPEVIGEGGVLVADGDVVAACAAVRRILDSAALRHDLAAAARRRAEQLTWSAAARAHAEVYGRVAR